jgi:CheY-like chemotaxis protein
MSNILVIEDMMGVRHAISSMLKRAGHTVEAVESGQKGLDELQHKRFDLVVTDILMPDMDGTEVLFKLRAMPDRPPVIAISGGGAGVSADAALQSAKLQADAFLQKPFEKTDLLAVVDRLLKKSTAA